MPEPARYVLRQCIGLFLLAIALLQLGFRGLQRIRHDVPMWDFASVFAAAKTWIHGGDPYVVSTVIRTWQQSGCFSDRDVSYFATVYPPTSLLMLTPLAALPANLAMVAWLLITLALLLLQWRALLELAGLPRNDPRVLILIGATLAAGGLQFGILSGQLSIPAISLCVIAFWQAGRGKDGLAGALLGLAFALKPQVAGPFIVYYLVLRRSGVAGAALLVGGLFWVAAVIAMRLSHIHWIAGWMQSVAATTEVGAVNDYGWANRFRDEIIDLKMLAVSVVHSPRLMRLGVEAVVLGLFAWYVSAFPRGARRTPREELLALAGLSALALLPVYHRVYDVALLTTALAWALAELDGSCRRYAIAALTAMAVFLVPFDSLKSAGSRLHLGAVAGKWWWQSLVAPHYAWGLLATTIVLLIAMGRPRGARGGSADLTLPV